MNLFKRETSAYTLLEYKLLENSIRKGLIEPFNNLITTDVNVNASMKNGCSLLHYAAMNGSHLIVEGLLKRGTIINAIDNYNITDLHIDARQNCKDVLTFVLNCKQEVQRLKDKKITKNISLYDVLRIKDDEEIAYLQNENVVEELSDIEFEKMYPIYASMLRIRISEGKTRNRLVELSQICFESIMEIKLPHLVIRKIFSYVNNLGLRNLIQAAPMEKEKKIFGPIL